MEIHRPHLTHNWREFLKEYGIIVLGVLTALLAEQAVQSIDWHQKVEAAIADMDNELSIGDGPQAYTRLALDKCVTTQLDAIRAAVERGDRARSRTLIEGLWLPRRTYDYLAREAAAASDVSSHMAPGRMLNYRIAYEVVPNMNRLAEKELSDQAHLHALPRTGGPLAMEERLASIDALEALRADNFEMTREASFLLRRMKVIGLGLDRASVSRNLADAPPQNSGCLLTISHA